MASKCCWPSWIDAQEWVWRLYGDDTNSILSPQLSGAIATLRLRGGVETQMFLLMPGSLYVVSDISLASSFSGTPRGDTSFC